MAETEIEKLVVRITGDSSSYQRAVAQSKEATSELEKQFAEAEQSMTRLEKAQEASAKAGVKHAKEEAEARTQVLEKVKDQAKEAGTALLGLGGVSLGAFALAGIVEGVHHANESMVEMKHTAEELGIKAGVFQALKAQATSLDVPVEQVTTSLYRMKRAITEGVQSGPASEAAKQFGRLGMSVDQLIGLSPDKQFEAVADAIKGMENSTERAAATQEIFGRGSQRIGRLLEEGSEGIKRFSAQMQGVVTDDELEQVEKAKTAVDRMAGSWNKLWREMAIGSSGILKETMDAIALISKGAGRLPAQGRRLGEAIMGFFDPEGARDQQKAKRINYEADQQKRLEEDGKKESDILKRRNEEARKQVRELAKTLSGKLPEGVSKTSGASSIAEFVKQQQAEIDAEASPTIKADRVKQLAEDIKTLNEAAKGKDFKDFMDGINKSSQGFGYATTVAEAYQKGVQGLLPAEALIAAQEADRSTKLKQLNADAEKHTQALWDQAAVMNLTVSAAEEYKAKQEGLTGAQLKNRIEAGKNLEAAKKQKELMDKGKQAAEKYLTPQQKLIKEQKELDEMYKKGAIELNVYLQGLKELEKQTQKSYKVDTKLEAIEAGSAAALSLIEEQGIRSGTGLAHTPVEREPKEGGAGKKRDKFGNIAGETGFDVPALDTIAEGINQLVLNSEKQLGKDPLVFTPANVA